MNQSIKAVLSSDQKFQQRVGVVRVALNQGTQVASIKFGISVRTIRSWKRRFKLFGISGLKDRSRCAVNIWNKKDKDHVLENALIKLDKVELGLNRMQVLTKLMVEPTTEIPTLSWISRTRKRLGLVRKKRQKENHHKHRYEIPIPGALQIDTKYVENALNPKDKLYQFTAIDECSRVRFLAGSLFKSAKSARKFLIDAIEFYRTLGVEVWRVQTDHGTEFTLPETERVANSFAKGQTPEHIFTKECDSRNIRHRLIKVATPELNGKVERSHRIDNERFYSRYGFSDEHALDHALKTIWMPEYNELRPHGSLNYKTPMDFLKFKQDQLKNEKIKELKYLYEEKKAA
jgi:transposase InsO family protein